MSKLATLPYERGGMQKDYYNQSDVMARSCPLCGSGDYSDIHKEREALGIVKCKRCKLIYTNPIVKQPEQVYWGDEKKYYQEAKLIFEGLAKHHRDPNYLADLRIIERIKPEGRLLDIGTNMGFFLRHTRQKRWETYGVEPSPALSDMARRYFGLNVITGYLKDAKFADNFFDIVTMTDVFEHIVEPKKVLSQIKRILKTDGILFIKVPNGKYNLLKLWIAKATKRLKNYDIFDSYEHVTHYTHNSLKGMLEDCGFTIKKVFIGRPIQLPVWHKHVGHYYQYPSPWVLDATNYILRVLFYWLSKFEFIFRIGNIGYFAPNIIVVAQHNSRK